MDQTAYPPREDGAWQEAYDVRGDVVCYSRRAIAEGRWLVERKETQDGWVARFWPDISPQAVGNAQAAMALVELAGMRHGQCEARVAERLNRVVRRLVTLRQRSHWAGELEEALRELDESLSEYCRASRAVMAPADSA
ncbi:hypothetical protein OH491_00285 [Termitidicoccus mucosus]|uniref:hypothetical protein n=1 Tax=Termitidicoccus mucosus TaxID=1184151 RepID=UPI0011AB3A32